MPKKYQNRAFLTKPASSAPSTLKSGQNRPSSENHGTPVKPTVNDLLRESRRAHTELVHGLDNVASSSLPPELRAALHIAPPSAPAPRHHLRGPARLRRIPGPPPPQSWLTQSQHAPEDVRRSAFHQLRWLRARIQQQSSTLPGGYFPSTTSLEHLVLKKIATHWSWHVKYDHAYLASLPPSMRAKLLSYLAVYDEAHWPNPLPLLFPSDCDQDDLDVVTRLDLSNSLGSWASVKKIEKELVTTKEYTGAQVSQSFQQAGSETIPDSWDDEVLSLPSITVSANLQNDRLRFINLKHISLAVNPASSAAPVSWAHLISLSSHLNRLTSLSLANWPTPTYTPNASKGRVKIVNSVAPSAPAQIYGGSDMYTAFDNNWREAAGILRTLSRNLYCITWLDLSGCASWLTALTWQDENGDSVGADWTGAWRNIDTMKLAVGWLPGRPPSIEDEISSISRSTSSIDSTRAIEQLYGGQLAIQEALAAIENMRLGTPRQQLDEDVQPTWNVEFEREKQYFRRDVERYISHQNTAKQVAEDIKAIRKRSGTITKWIEFDFGEILDEETIRIE